MDNGPAQETREIDTAERSHRRRTAAIALVLLVAGVTLFCLWVGVRPQRLLDRALHRGAGPAASPFTDAQARDALKRESGYLAACSYTEQAGRKARIFPGSAAYGALNDVRIGDHGADWVAPEAGAIGAISLMKAAAFARAHGEDTRGEDAVLDAYFDVWLTGHRQGWVGDAGSSEAGGMAARVYYDGQGRRTRSEDATPAATGMTVVALWKRCEYLAGTGRAAAGMQWLTRAWPPARAAGEYLLRHQDTRFGLVRGPASSGDFWLTDAVAATDALRCLDCWAKTLKRPDPRYAAAASAITTGIVGMKERGDWSNFYRVRHRDHDYEPEYGDSLDQLCFLPYEADVLPPGEEYARRISDWWTLGGNEVSMTAQTTDAADWKYYGTHWHHYFVARPENEYLYPGPGLQLAKVEWKYAAQTHDPELRRRAVNRLRWAARREYSALWLGATAPAQPDGGLVDWRDGANYPRTAETWARFIDTSAYFIQVTLMVNFNQDTRYVPEAPFDAPR
jgi:hypothetical protein